MDEFRNASQLTMSAAGPVMRSAMSKMSDMTLSSEGAVIDVILGPGRRPALSSFVEGP
jgi:hypothetical protein